MRVDVFSTHANLVERCVRDRTAIVIDVLRATSCMVTALSNGAREVIPVEDVEEALKMGGRLGRENVLLGGERNALLIPGFDLGNSPLEYSGEKVRGKVIVATTTNGTRAIRRARTSGARRILVGAYLNARAVADRVRDEDEIAIVCSGTAERFSLDDVMAAGSIIAELRELGVKLELDDLGYNALFLYDQYKRHPEDLLLHCGHYRRLVELGFDDLTYCFTQNKLDVVPSYDEDGAIRAH
ncbi:2-phosphosulfolactate phosphatase [Gehongia tenuis]|uniref:Probable 2-phosphosulfolactate phosphatase n=1 Tax=Gehongia tenuis TaxID=2763655 RepID=A0A926D0S3_9FIRM|nr:2-phosphosulfolactate phosphatase [Gehongia tenuis]MBC8530245.1 2-phosphosulfolactate phosphatase [Gehongia tenuis]